MRKTRNIKITINYFDLENPYYDIQINPVNFCW
jgi:hypothetical protein